MIESELVRERERIPHQSRMTSSSVCIKGENCEQAPVNGPRAEESVLSGRVPRGIDAETGMVTQGLRGMPHTATGRGD